MRVLTWNMNVPVDREPWDLLERLEPDIAHLQETVIPDDLDGRYSVAWTRAWDNRPWGTAILSRVGQLRTVWEDSSRGAVVVATCSVPELGEVSLAAIHARVIERRVIPALRETLHEVRGRLGPRLVVGGDLNTARAAAKAWPRNGHREFWEEEVPGLGLRDCHFEKNGYERQSYWREWAQNKPPTIGNSLQDDHLFVDDEVFSYVRQCVVWDTREGPRPE